jgi:hypothetical protein
LGVQTLALLFAIIMKEDLRRYRYEKIRSSLLPSNSAMASKIRSEMLEQANISHH